MQKKTNKQKQNKIKQQQEKMNKKILRNNYTKNYPPSPKRQEKSTLQTCNECNSPTLRHKITVDNHLPLKINQPIFSKPSLIAFLIISEGILN